jgi:phage-related protein
MSLIEALPTIISELVKALPTIIKTIITTLLSNIPLIIKAAIELFFGLIKAIPQIIIELVKSLPDIIKSIVQGLIEGIPELIKAGGELLSGLFNGLLNPQKIWESVKKLFSNIMDGIKSLFGIHSPSKVMENQVGKMLAEGIGVGFKDEIGTVNKQMAKAVQLPNMIANASQNVNSQMSVVATPTSTVSSMLGKYLPHLADRQQIVLDTGVLVGETAPMYNKAIGRMVRQGL